MSWVQTCPLISALLMWHWCYLSIKWCHHLDCGEILAHYSISLLFWLSWNHHQVYVSPQTGNLDKAASYSHLLRFPAFFLLFSSYFTWYCYSYLRKLNVSLCGTNCSFAKGAWKMTTISSKYCWYLSTICIKDIYQPSIVACCRLLINSIFLSFAIYSHKLKRRCL